MAIFKTNGYHFYKLNDNNECVEVYKSPIGDLRIEMHTFKLISSLCEITDSKECTESEFIDAYNEVKNKLEDLVLKS